MTEISLRANRLAKDPEARTPDRPHASTPPTETVEHLTEFDCMDCGHGAVDHYRNPGCRHWRTCRCNADPLCWCGLLASKHLATTDAEGAEG